MQGFGTQRTHKTIYNSRKQKKVMPWEQLLPGVAEKLISSTLSRGMERKEPIKIFIYNSKKQKKNLLPGIVKKLINSNPCRGLECKEHTKRC